MDAVALIALLILIHAVIRAAALLASLYIVCGLLKPKPQQNPTVAEIGAVMRSTPKPGPRLVDDGSLCASMSLEWEITVEHPTNSPNK